MTQRLKGKRLLLADDQDFVREGVPNVLRQEGLIVHVCIGETDIRLQRPEGLIVHVCNNGPAVWRILATYHTAFNALILDLHGMGCEQEFRPEQEVPALLQAFPQLPIIVFSVESRFARQYLEAGVHGYVVKDDQATCLIPALLNVLVEGNVYCSPKTRQDVWELITLQERELLHLAAEGHLQKEIAHQMDASLDQVENTIRRIRGKLGAKNITHAVALAFRQGLLQ